MARGLRRTLAGAAALAAGPHAAWADSCFQEGMKYYDPFLSETTPMGGTTRSAEGCQRKCQNDLTCEHFTWRQGATSSWGPGGCFIFRYDYAKLVPAIQNVSAGLVVAGPRSCLEANGTLAPRPGTPAAEASATTALPPTSLEPLALQPTTTQSTTLPPTLPHTLPPTLQPTLPAVVTFLPPTVAEAGANSTAANGTGSNASAAVVPPVEPAAAGGGGFPIWGGILIIAGLVGLGAAAMYLCAGEGGKEKKKKRRSTRGIKVAEGEEQQPARLVEEAAPEAAPLMRAEPAPTPPLPAPALAVPTPTFQGPNFMAAEPVAAQPGLLQSGYAAPQAVPYLQPPAPVYPVYTLPVPGAAPARPLRPMATMP
mmetsp:Transcript_107727/g.304753  ORF Transcript_107727/g.304753 Transcript_107727/m.304753 type:complete len:368 (-) Transcript_107727:76-1179(-)